MMALYAYPVFDQSALYKYKRKVAILKFEKSNLSLYSNYA